MLCGRLRNEMLNFLWLARFGCVTGKMSYHFLIIRLRFDCNQPYKFSFKKSINLGGIRLSSFDPRVIFAMLTCKSCAISRCVFSCLSKLVTIKQRIATLSFSSCVKRRSNREDSIFSFFVSKHNFVKHRQPA